MTFEKNMRPSVKLERQLRQNEALYREACAVFGGAPRVFRHYHPAAEMSVDLLTGTDTPQQGAVSCATLGMMHYPVGQRAGEKPLRFEIAGACLAEYEYFPDLVSDCAMRIMAAQEKCYKGAVLNEVVRQYLPGSRMHHVLLAPFSLWERPLGGQAFDDVCVQWLTVLLISSAERDYLTENGLDALLCRLAAHRASLLNPRRDEAV